MASSNPQPSLRNPRGIGVGVSIVGLGSKIVFVAVKKIGKDVFVGRILVASGGTSVGSGVIVGSNVAVGSAAALLHPTDIDITNIDPVISLINFAFIICSKPPFASTCAFSIGEY
jgi:acetyltransferase-like isoleucine patch superfamily enzyme